MQIDISNDGKVTAVTKLVPRLAVISLGGQWVNPSLFLFRTCPRNVCVFGHPFSYLQGAQSPQLSFLWHPVHSPHRLRFFLTGLS